MITCHKLELVGILLRLGYDVLFSDVDVAFIRDPFPFLIRDSHFEFQGNNRFNLQFRCDENEPGNSGITFKRVSVVYVCAGFYFAKAQAPTIATFAAALDSCHIHPNLDDQTLLFNVIFAQRQPGK